MFTGFDQQPGELTVVRHPRRWRDGALEYGLDQIVEQRVAAERLDPCRIRDRCFPAGPSLEDARPRGAPTPRRVP